MLEWALENALIGALLFTVVAVVARTVRVRPAILHVAWCLVLVRFIMPPVLPPAFPAWPDAGGDSVDPLSYWIDEKPSEASSPESKTGARESSGTFIFASGTTRTDGVPGVSALLRDERYAGGRRLVLWAWALGAAVVVLRELRGARRVARLVRGAEAAGPAVREHARAVAHAMGIEAPMIRIVPGLPAPFVWSWARPVLCLGSADTLPTRSVLAHEFAHLKRRDHRTAWLELGVLAVQWWNPLVHLARREMHTAMEHACDARVVARYPDERLAYASALVDAAEASRDLARAGWAEWNGTPALGVVGRAGRVVESRLVQILNADDEARVPGLAVVALTLLAVPALADWSLAGPERDAEFTDPGIARMLEGFGVESWGQLEARSRAELGKDPSHGVSHKNLGLALLARGAWDAGAEAFQRQIACGFQPENARYNLACAHARRGNADAAIALLEGLAARGSLDRAGLARDPDLAPLAADARWQALVGPMARDQP
ncbi:MAG: hypothetical protein GY711_16355 [bacterium]|nr:hypothetical protein [bacterium]